VLTDYLGACMRGRLGPPGRRSEEGPEWECCYDGQQVRVRISHRTPNGIPTLMIREGGGDTLPGPMGIRFVDVPTFEAALRASAFFARLPGGPGAPAPPSPPSSPLAPRRDLSIPPPAPRQR
jgi:hypothetical protein